MSRPSFLLYSLAIVFVLLLGTNTFIRVSDINHRQESGIVMDFIFSHSLWASLTVFAGAVFLVYACFLLWGIFRAFSIPGIMPFWKLVKNYPDEAFQWFLVQEEWEVLPYEFGKNYKEQFPCKEWEGPFHLWVPSIGRRVCLFGKVGRYESSREMFIQLITRIEKI